MNNKKIQLKQPNHKQVIAKVNAYVDEDIKELIELLNTFDSVWTSESCQGYGNEMTYIVLSYGSIRNYNGIKTFEFVERLAKTIKEVIDEMKLVCQCIWLSLEWTGNMEIPDIVFKCTQADISKMTKVFYSVRKKFE